MNTIQIQQTPLLTEGQKQAALKLWNSEYPKELQHASLFVFENYLSKLENTMHYFLTAENDETVGWAFVFDRDEERWFGIILDHTVHGLGLGKLLMKQLQKDEFELNGWVIDHKNSVTADGRPYVSPLDFYKKLKFQILHDIRLELPHISAVKIHWLKLNLN